MRLSDIFEEWDRITKKRPRSVRQIFINNVNELDDYTRELTILVSRRSALKISQPMLAKSLGCSRETIRNYETRRSTDNWLYIYAAKYVLDQYEWHLNQMEAHKLMVVAGTPIRQ